MVTTGYYLLAFHVTRAFHQIYATKKIDREGLEQGEYYLYRSHRVLNILINIGIFLTDEIVGDGPHPFVPEYDPNDNEVSTSGRRSHCHKENAPHHFAPLRHGVTNTLFL